MTTDIVHAPGDDDSPLPVIDLTHPAFAVPITDAGYAALAAEFVREAASRPPLTPEIAAALERSHLGAALLASSGTFLSGMATYRLKLGAEHLGPDADPIDRRIAGSYPVLGLRIRLRDIARLLAGAIETRLRDAPAAPLHLINIAGGPASDSWNALLLLQAAHADLLKTRTTVIHVFDLDSRGPEFGCRALASLRAPGAPLAGVDVSLRALPYQWSNADDLRRALAALPLDGAVCAASSEGGLFDYGDDAEIVANLQVLRDALGPGATVAGSITSDCEATRATRRQGGASTRPRTLENFTALIARAGWAPLHIIARPMSYHLALI